METFSLVIAVLSVLLAMANVIAAAITKNFETKVTCLLWAIVLTQSVGY